MKAGDGYALDLLSPVRYVATELDRVAPAALSAGGLAEAYVHSIPGDLSRIRQREGRASDTEAILWLIERAIAELPNAVTSDGNGGYRLVKDFDKIRYKGEKLIRLVEADDEDEKRTLRAMHNDMREDRTFYVTVLGAKGGKQERAFRLHPLARIIPQIDEKEFLELAADVKVHGVKVPIVVFDGAVLDGRHRLAAAAALDVPVRVDEFVGTEEEARDHVVSLNVKRRHLTIAQRGLIVRELYLPQARAEAKERQRESGGDKTGHSTQRTNALTATESAKATEIAATASSGLANVRTIETMAPVDDAPKTKQRIRTGEIKTATAARREALRETGSNESEDLPGLPRSALQYLYQALWGARKACNSLEEGRAGTAKPADILARINTIRAELDRAEKLI